MPKNRNPVTTLSEDVNYTVRIVDLVEELQILLNDYFTCAVDKGDDNLKLKFTNGQILALTVAKNNFNIRI